MLFCIGSVPQAAAVFQTVVSGVAQSFLELLCGAFICKQDLSLASVPLSSLQTLHLSALLCYGTLIYGSLYDNGLIIAEAKQLNTFPVHEILYTNNEDRIIIAVNQTSWIWTEMWSFISSSHLKSVMVLLSDGDLALFSVKWRQQKLLRSYAVFKLIDSLLWGSGPPTTASVKCPTSLHAGCTLVFKIHCELIVLTRDHIYVEQIWNVTNQRQMQGCTVSFYFLSRADASFARHSIYEEMAKVALEKKQVLKMKGKESVQRTLLRI